MSDDGVLTIADEAALRAQYPERSKLSAIKELEIGRAHV